MIVKAALRLVPVLTIGCGSFAVAATSVVAPWTTYQGNALHTGYVPIILKPSNFNTLWSVAVGNSGAALQQVTESGGLVFLSQSGYYTDQGVYVLRAKNGSTLWSLSFPDTYSVNPPAYDNGNIYLQVVGDGQNNWVLAYNAASGTPVFQSAQDAQGYNYLAPTIVDHTLYVEGGDYGGMSSFNGATGNQNWFVQLAQFDLWTPAVDSTYAYSYLGGNDGSGGSLTAVNRSTGVIAFSIPDLKYVFNSYSMNEAPALGSQHDALVTNGGRLISFDLVHQTIRWSQSAGFTGQASVAGGIIYVVNNGTLSARSEATGDQLWLWSSTSDTLTGPVVVTDSHVFVSGSATTYAIDTGTHEVAWSYPEAGALTLSDGQLFIAGSTGQLTDIALGTVYLGGADVAETLQALASAPNEPRSFHFTATTLNKGPDSATGITLTITVPPSFGVESPPSGCSFAGQTLQCSYASLAPGGKILTNFGLVPSETGSFSVSATVTADQTDLVSWNNTAVFDLHLY